VKVLQENPLPVRAVRFYAVGGLGIAVQLAVVWLLRDGAGINLSLATALAVETALLHNFAWHECWTWKDRQASWSERLGRLLRFHASNGLISLAGNLILMKVLHDGLGVHYLIANATSIVICSVVNYFASEYFVFRQPAAD